MNRTRWFGAIVVAAVLVTGFVLSPWLSMSNLVQALQDGDRYRVETYVDFPRLKASLRDQMKAQLTENLQQELKDNPFAALGMLMGTAAVDSMVDAFVSPANLSRMMQGSRRNDRSTSGAPNSRLEIAKRLYARTYMDWLSLSSIRVMLLDEDQQVVTTMRLQRVGLHWQVVDLDIPKVN